MKQPNSMLWWDVSNSGGSRASLWSMGQQTHEIRYKQIQDYQQALKKVITLMWSMHPSNKIVVGCHSRSTRLMSQGFQDMVSKHNLKKAVMQICMFDHAKTAKVQRPYCIYTNHVGIEQLVSSKKCDHNHRHHKFGGGHCSSHHWLLFQFRDAIFRLWQPCSNPAASPPAL